MYVSFYMVVVVVFVGGSKQEFARGGWGLILRLGAVGGQHTCFTFNEQSY